MFVFEFVFRVSVHVSDKVGVRVRILNLPLSNSLLKIMFVSVALSYVGQASAPGVPSLWLGFRVGVRVKVRIRVRIGGQFRIRVRVRVRDMIRMSERVRVRVRPWERSP